MDPSNRENKKKSHDPAEVKVTEGICSCKRPRTPLSNNVKVKEGHSLRSSISNGLKGLRSRKSSPHNKCQIHVEGKKVTSDKRHSCGFTPINHNADARMTPEFDAVRRTMASPMDIAYRTPSPMDCTSRPTTPSGAVVAPRVSYPRSTPSPISGSKPGPAPVAYTIMRPKVPSRSNSRIGISLDMVDLWDPEESESELEASQSGFDRINGIAINPRKTVDLSELRRTGAFSEFERAQSPIKQAQDAMMDRLNQETGNYTGSESQSEARHDARARRREIGAGRPRVRMTANMKAHLTYPPNPSSPRNNSTCNYNNIAKDSNRSREATTGREVTPSTNSQSQQRTHSNQSQLRTHSSQSQQRTHPSQPQQRTLPILIKKNSKSRPQESSPKVPPTHRVLNQTYDFTDSANSSPSSRRVNFNNMVTVQDGEMSTLETLKSSNNSAQLIKQKYLSKLTMGHHSSDLEGTWEPHQSKDLSPREEVTDVQLAY